MPPDSPELLTLEREIRDLADSAETFAEARAECERAVERARARVAEIAVHLHDAEESARERLALRNWPMASNATSTRPSK